MQLDNEIDQYQVLECPVKAQSNGFFRIVGSCNGLLCLSDDYFSYTDTIILWNPTIRRYLKLPRPRITFRNYGPYMFVLGFGFDCWSKDYKVVRVSYIQGDDGSDKVPPEVEVYSLSTGCWGGISTDVPPYYMVEKSWSQVFMNGAVHWVVYTKTEKGGFNNFILGLDIRNETFNTMNLPESLANKCPLNLSIVEFEGSLSVVQCNNCLKPAFGNIWVMKEYGVMESWTRQIIVDLQDDSGVILGCRNNGELIVTKRGMLTSYNLNSHQFSDMRIHGMTNSFYANSYVESIGLLDKANDAGKKNRKNSSAESEINEKFEDSFLKEEDESNEEGGNSSAAEALRQQRIRTCHEISMYFGGWK